MVILTESSPTFFFQKYDLPSDPILLILVSSDHKTPFQSPNIQFSWYLQKKIRCSSLWPFWEDFCQDYHLYNIMKVVCLNEFLAVWSVTGSGKVFLIKWVASTALSSLQLVVWWIIGNLSPRESLERNSFLLFPLSPLASLLIIPMVDFQRPVLDWIWHKE